MSVWVMEQGVDEYCLQVSQDPTNCYYEIPEQESLVEIIGIPFILFLIVMAIAVVLVYRWSMKQEDKISCPHCGAKWWSYQGPGFESRGGYFCYNCQRYW